MLLFVLFCVMQVKGECKAEAKAKTTSASTAAAVPPEHFFPKEMAEYTSPETIEKLEVISATATTPSIIGHPQYPILLRNMQKIMKENYYLQTLKSSSDVAGTSMTSSFSPIAGGVDNAKKFTSKPRGSFHNVEVIE